MALTVEDGTNVAGADSFNTLVELDAHHANNSAWTGDNPTKEAAAQRATVRMGLAYAWKGTRTHGRDQATIMPRTGMVDCEGIAIASNEIPQEVKDAHAEMSLVELLKPSMVTAAVLNSDERQIKMEDLDGLKTEYFFENDPAQKAVSPTQPSQLVSSILRCFATPIDVPGKSPIQGASSRG